MAPIQDPVPCSYCGSYTHMTDNGGYIPCPGWLQKNTGEVFTIASEFPPLPRDSFRTRPSWDRYFLAIADVVSTRATCPRRAVGAVLVKDKRILATGFNGSPPGLPHCTEDGCWIEDGHCVRVIHAEHNAVLQGARYGISLEGAECYANTLPCLGCAKVLVSVGIKRVVYSSDYNPDSRLLELGLTLEYLAS